jgi:hypothetical protein
MYPSRNPTTGGTNCFNSLGMFLTSGMVVLVCYDLSDMTWTGLFYSKICLFEFQKFFVFLN